MNSIFLFLALLTLSFKVLASPSLSNQGLDCVPADPANSSLRSVRISVSSELVDKPTIREKFFRRHVHMIDKETLQAQNFLETPPPTNNCGELIKISIFHTAYESNEIIDRLVLADQFSFNTENSNQEVTTWSWDTKTNTLKAKTGSTTQTFNCKKEIYSAQPSWGSEG